jgi:glucose-6-phosphate-specific signal transduction histidine kinase
MILELMLAGCLWALGAIGLWNLSSRTMSENPKVDFVLCLLWPISLPLALFIIAFRRL